MISGVLDTDLDCDDWGDLSSKIPQDSSWSHLVDQLYSPTIFHPSTSFSATKLPQADCSSLHKMAMGSIFPKASVQSFFPIASEILRGQVSSKEGAAEKPLPVDPSELDVLYAPISADDCFNLLTRCVDNKQLELFGKIIDAPHTPVLEPNKAGSLLVVIHADDELVEYGEKLFFSRVCPAIPQQFGWHALKFLANNGHTELFFRYLESDKIPVLEPLYSFCLLYYIFTSDDWGLEETTKDLIRKLLESPKLTFDQVYAGYTTITLAERRDIEFLLEMFFHEKFSELSTCDKMLSLYLAALNQLFCCCC